MLRPCVTLLVCGFVGSPLLHLAPARAVHAFSAASARSSGQRLEAEQASEEAVRARWLERLAEARARAAAARDRYATAQAAEAKQRQRRYPRGEAKAALQRELEAARLELEEALQALEATQAAAARAGVSQTLREGEP